jgi:hypothetical protein
MTDERDTAAVLVRAQALLQGGELGSGIVRQSARVGTPIAVLAPDGSLDSWFVAVTVGDRLAGFFQLLPDLTLMRYSSFQRREDTLEGCPAAGSWTDADSIRRRAQAHARPGETAGEPVLSYDRAPSRLAWTVSLTAPDGTTRKLCVAGHAVWEAPPAGDGIDAYGGPSPRPDG